MAAIQGGLERLLGTERFQNIKSLRIGENFKPYDAGIDAFCLNTYSYYAQNFEVKTAYF